ncbi:MAG TPA: hypothetical protein VG326_11410 [Tepidisphaeraceae bacterium]|jgi:hypothetical protein|nr:hypothetical protein [Tepidisphaeraceae bacterium]
MPVDEDEPLVEINLDLNASGDLGTQAGPITYECSICRRTLPASQVYEANGAITCTECWNQAQVLAARVAAATAQAPGQASAVERWAAQPSASEAAAPAAPRRPKPPARPALLPRVTCPHCFQRFAPQDILWVSRHPDLMGDPVAGPDAPLRFLPSRFTFEGDALDARGLTCQTVACPGCHLIIPRPLIEAEPLFVSIVGATASGKTCFMTCMTWELRRLLPLYFGVSFNDADTHFNRTLDQQEQTLFLADHAEQPAKLDKTAASGPQLYDHIRVGRQIITLPRPLLFMMRPTPQHPKADLAAQVSRVVCMYDNAGEHFNPGENAAMSPLTLHLGTSRVLMFLYDPTQDPRFRARLREMSADPQIKESSPISRQETILTEMASRVRQFAGLPATQQAPRALVVVVPKADIWGPLVNLDLSTEPIIAGALADGSIAGVDVGRIDGVSAIIREMLLQTAPDVVSTADAFASRVVYIPVSALGDSPAALPDREGLWVRPSRIKPRWVTAPFLYMFARWSHDLIAGVSVKAE